MEVSNELKQNNWALYELAMSPDPALASQFVGKLLGSLEAAARMSGITEYDVVFHTYGPLAKRAWFEYSEKNNPGMAMQTVNVILAGITHIVYDRRVSAAKASGFSGTVQKGGFENGLRV